MRAHEADQPAVREPDKAGFLVVDDAGRVVAERREILPIVAAVVGAHQRRARAFALAFFLIAMDAAVETHQQ